MKIDYMLCVQGNLALPNLNIALNATAEDGAKIEASRAMAPLHAAGYRLGWLYDVREVMSVKVCKLRTEQDDVRVIVKD